MDAAADVLAKRRSLAPREHGAYAQLGMPLVAVLLAGRPSAAGASLALAACAAFAAHEPLLVVLGQRGTRARREDGRRARQRFVVDALGSVALALIAFGLAPAARPWAVIPLALAVVSLLSILRRIERTLPGELIASAALTSAALPVAIASGIAPGVALSVCAVFYATSLVSTVEVRAIARHETTLSARGAAWAISGAVVLGVALDAPRFALSAIPTLATVIVIAASHPKPAHLRRLGWALVAASIATAAGVVLAARAAE